tara:strand:- start:1026 stop:1292 length:267 start_codon:yes stop_codon:yes gene_type:complete
MKVGDLVKLKHDATPFGFVLKIDKDFYGARQAFKSNPKPRGQAILDRRKPDFLAPTTEGIQDRVLVDWIQHGAEYVSANQLEVISESR